MWYHICMRKLVALLGSALLLAGGAAAATTPSATQYRDRANGYSVTVPPKWYAVPRSVAAVNRTIALLKQQKKADLAKAYGFFLTAAGKTELKAYKFQAFYFDGPTSSPVPIQVSIQVAKGPRAYKAADLAAAGAAYANALTKDNNATVTTPKLITLPAGKAEFLTGTIPRGDGVSSGFELYVLIHSGKLYALNFEIDALVLSQAKVFRSIAEHFAFV
jgi:hypothetical protein